jgi:hypothetical protein
MPRWLSKITSNLSATNDNDVPILSNVKSEVFYTDIPDYAKMETFNRITSDGGSWIVDRDGFMLLRLFGEGNMNSQFTIDGSLVSMGYSWNTGTYTDTTILKVKKGNVVKFVGPFDHNVSSIFIPPVRSLGEKTINIVAERTTPYIPPNGFPSIIPLTKVSGDGDFDSNSIYTIPESGWWIFNINLSASIDGNSNIRLGASLRYEDLTIIANNGTGNSITNALTIQTVATKYFNSGERIVVCGGGSREVTITYCTVTGILLRH